MNIIILDSATLGGDIDFSLFKKLGSVSVYKTTNKSELAQRISDCDIIIVNKIKLNRENLCNAKRLKLICVTATGFDNIDIKYCKENGIAVCNVKGYSADSVAQVTVSMALSLANNIRYFDDYVKNGSYSQSGMQNHLKPVFHEISGQTWGIVGLGSIGKRVAEVAKALGCRVIAFKRKPDDEYECVSLDRLCRRADIISVHLPLSNETRGILSREMIGLMKQNAIVINAARGDVVNESALADAILEKRIGGLGVDVYSSEPIDGNSPYNRLSNYRNVIFTPHMAWGAYEARVRCMEEIVLNINAFINGEKRNRVDG